MYNITFYTCMYHIFADEFIVEAVAGQDVVLGPHQNHFHNNIYVAAGTLCLAITIVALVVCSITNF